MKWVLLIGTYVLSTVFLVGCGQTLSLPVQSVKAISADFTPVAIDGQVPIYGFDRTCGFRVCFGDTRENTRVDGGLVLDMGAFPPDLQAGSLISATILVDVSGTDQLLETFRECADLACKSLRLTATTLSVARPGMDIGMLSSEDLEPISEVAHTMRQGVREGAPQTWRIEADITAQVKRLLADQAGVGALVIRLGLKSPRVPNTVRYGVIETSYAPGVPPQGQPPRDYPRITLTYTR